jgi:hypothetical protein
LQNSKRKENYSNLKFENCHNPKLVSGTQERIMHWKCFDSTSQHAYVYIERNNALEMFLDIITIG